MSYSSCSLNGLSEDAWGQIASYSLPTTETSHSFCSFQILQSQLSNVGTPKQHTAQVLIAIMRIIFIEKIGHCQLNGKWRPLNSIQIYFSNRPQHEKPMFYQKYRHDCSSANVSCKNMVHTVSPKSNIESLVFRRALCFFLMFYDYLSLLDVLITPFSGSTVIDCSTFKIYSQLTRVEKSKTVLGFIPPKSNKNNKSSWKPKVNHGLWLPNIIYGNFRCRNHSLIRVINIFSLVMMQRMRGIKDLISFKNEECTCFGSALQGEQKFLAKQKSFNLPPSPISNPNHLMPKDHSFFKKNFKKSLKKHFTPLFHHGKSDRTIDVNGNACLPKAPEPADSQKETRTHFTPRGHFHGFNHKTFSTPGQCLGPLYSAQFPQPIAEQMSKHSSHNTLPPYMPTSPRPAILIPALQTHKQIRFNFHSPIAMPTAPNNEQKGRSASPVSLKTIDRTTSQANLASKNEDDLINKDQLRKCESSKNFTQNYAQIGVKKITSDFEKQSSFREEKAMLKRMDEVAEIYSQIDSEEEYSDSDVESVVIGRLDEYSSTMDHDLSQISTVERSAQGKVIRFNSLMTNFDFDRTHGTHGTTSQLLSY